MSKFRSSILIIGGVVMCIATALITFLVLTSVGLIVSDPIKLVYSVEDTYKIYDGTPLVADTFELTDGKLLNGHSAVVEVVGSQTDVGESESGLNIRILDENGYDVSKSYEIKVNSGKLTVDKNSIYIKMSDVEATYTGEKIVCDNYELLEGTLCTGHKIVPAVDGNGIVEVGERLPETVAPLIFDAAGNDVTGNYDIKYTAGVVNVNPRPIILRPVGAVKEYDGKPLGDDRFELVSGSLVSGHYAKVTVVPADGSSTVELIDAGSMKIEIGETKIYTIVDSREVDVTHNYAISSGGTADITITRRPITVYAKSATFTYDGERHSFADDYPTDNEPQSVDNLVNGDAVSLFYNPDSFIVTVDSGKEYGEVVNVIDSVEISDKDGNSHTDNYEITCVDGTLRLNKKIYNIRLKDFDEIYESFDAAKLREKFENDIESVIECDESMYLVGNIGLDFGTPAVDMIDVGKYTYGIEWIAGGTLSNTDRENSVLEFELGKVEILKKTVSAAVISQEAEYDGNQVTVDFTVDGASKELFEINGEFPAHAGNYTYSVKLKNPNDAKNYNIVTSSGNITIKPKKISITAPDRNIDYSGQAYSPKIDDITFSDNNIKNKFDIVYPFIKDVGIYTYTVRLKNTERPSDYDITLKDGTVIISPKSVTVTLANINKIYDGGVVTPNINSEGNSVVGLEKDKIELVYGRMVDAGEYTYTARLVSSENPSNYILTVNGGNVSISRKELQVQLMTYNYTYNGNLVDLSAVPLNNLIALPAADAAYGNKFDLVYGEMRNAGDYTYSVKLKPDENPSNYILKITEGKVSIGKVTLGMTYAGNPSKIEKVYDGKAMELDIDKITLTNNTGYNVNKIKLQSLIYRTAFVNVADTNVAGGGGRNLEVAFAKIIDAVTGADLSDNFIIDNTWSSIKVEILPRTLVFTARALELKTGDPKNSDILDDENRVKPLLQLSSLTPLIAGDYIDFTCFDYDYDLTDNTVIFSISDVLRDGESVAENYEFETEYIANIIFTN